MNRDFLCLKDIVDAIDKVESKTRLGRPKFNEDENVRVWIHRYLQVIGESLRALSAPFKSSKDRKSVV